MELLKVAGNLELVNFTYRFTDYQFKCDLCEAGTFFLHCVTDFRG
jgi:hypothetical protein